MCTKVVGIFLQSEDYNSSELVGEYLRCTTTMLKVMRNFHAKYVQTVALQEPMTSNSSKFNTSDYCKFVSVNGFQIANAENLQVSRKQSISDLADSLSPSHLRGQ